MVWPLKLVLNSQQNINNYSASARLPLAARGGGICRRLNPRYIKSPPLVREPAGIYHTWLEHRIGEHITGGSFESVSMGVWNQGKTAFTHLKKKLLNSVNEPVRLQKTNTTYYVFWYRLYRWAWALFFLWNVMSKWNKMHFFHILLIVLSGVRSDHPFFQCNIEHV